MDLDAILPTLLREPDTCRDEDVSGLAMELRSGQRARRSEARSVFAALVLQRPDLGSSNLVSAFLDGLGETEPDPGPARLFAALLARPDLAPGLDPVPNLVALPCRPELKLLLARAWVGWRPEALEIDDLVALAEELQGFRLGARFLVEVVEPWSWQGTVESRRVADLEEALGTQPRWPYSRALLHRQAARQTSRSVPRRPVLVPGRETAVQLDRRVVRRILFVQNLDIGQGDEILRAGTLLALLLAIDPDASVDLVTRRRHLYDHPRIRCHSIHQAERVRRLVAEGFEGVVWLDEVFAPEIRQLPWLPAFLRNIASEAELCFEAATLHNHLFFRQARVGGLDLVADFAALRDGPHDAYESLELLALRLGLPWVGEGGGAFAAPFVGSPSPEAASHIQSLKGEATRPLAVVQPFGGFAEIKGLCRSQGNRLAADLDGLVAEGYRVVVLPTGTDWGSTSVIEAAFSRTRPESREHLAIAPDPADPALPLCERPDLEPADRAIRLFKYLIRAADLIVSVDGWVAHLGALLERPVRLLLWAGSFDSDWYPRGARRCESLCQPAATSELERSVFEDSELVLSHGRRTLLVAALGGLRQPSEAAGEVLRKTLRSADPALRAAAARKSAPLLELQVVAEALRRALDDSWPEVRAAAATALLERGDLRRPEDPPSQVLRAHQAIAAQDWRQIEALGLAAMPALARAVRGEADFIRREARRYLQSFMRQRAQGAGRSPFNPGGSKPR
ncbi:MAG: hypothetical protein AAF657_10815 [Acidobacteriota bacterium]